ncbi:hypothetical protein JD969_01885 [Planctomycetota bacterium]|nr:hypothetical protein JD969_01885 [Planctomycetota bacterium]
MFYNNASQQPPAPYSQDFSTNADDWLMPFYIEWNEQDQNATAFEGAFSVFGAVNIHYNNGFKSSVDVYLDTNWAINDGFDYDFSIMPHKNGAKAFEHEIFRVAQTEQGLLIAADHKTSKHISASEVIEKQFTKITESGWYTFENIIREDKNNLGNYLADFNVYKQNEATPFASFTDNIADTEYGIGGHHSGWFRSVEFSDNSGILFDNAYLEYAPIPEPASLSILTLGSLALIRRSRK